MLYLCYMLELIIRDVGQGTLLPGEQDGVGVIWRGVAANNHPEPTCEYYYEDHGILHQAIG